MDPYKFDYSSRRQVVYGRRGMVCTSQPLAANAGLDILKMGGNAVDAAIATAICMTVLEPTSNGIGSDTFALVWVKDRLFGLNGSGRSPESIDPDAIRSAGYTSMPARGWIPVNVPGTPGAWKTLHERFGVLPFKVLFDSAVSYAREGYPVSPTVALLWEQSARKFGRELTDDCFRTWFDVFTKDGRAPHAGELWRCEALARTLEELAQTGCESFYRGELAGKIDAYSRATGGYLRAADLGAYRAEWVEPLGVDYKGYKVWELPPNGHGLVALNALKLLSQDIFPSKFDENSVHLQLEAMKLAFADGQKHITDPKYMTRSVKELLSDGYCASRRKLIGETARAPVAGDPASGGTVYLCAADHEGCMVSLIQSNYQGFGSGIVIPDTGISLNDRGANFTLDSSHCNCLAGGKRPYHTIIPGFLTKEGKAVGPFGVMGAFMQPQGHVQVVINTVDFGMNPQNALDAPRWQWTGGMNIELEQDFPRDIARKLAQRGHNISIAEDSLSFGRGQIIWRDESGVLMGATEKRADGQVAAW